MAAEFLNEKRSEQAAHANEKIAQHHRWFIRGMYRVARAEIEDLKGRDPFLDVRGPATQRKKPNPFNDDERHHILAFFREKELPSYAMGVDRLFLNKFGGPLYVNQSASDYWPRALQALGIRHRKFY